MKCSAVRFISSGEQRLAARRSPNCTFSLTVSHGKTAYCWKTTPRSGPGPVMRWPSTATEPVVGSRKPAMVFSSVVLPQPEGPSRQMNSPG